MKTTATKIAPVMTLTEKEASAAERVVSALRENVAATFDEAFGVSWGNATPQQWADLGYANELDAFRQNADAFGTDLLAVELGPDSRLISHATGVLLGAYGRAFPHSADLVTAYVRRYPVRP